MFENLIGLENQKKFLANFLKNKIKPPPLIMVGQKGCGKFSLAKVFAQTVFCEKNIACFKCNSCRSVLQNRHPDFIVISPIKGSIRLSQIHDLQTQLKIYASSSPYKIVVIRESQTMGVEAATAFLKTFEEITQNSLLILNLSIEKSIIPTILSRGVKMYFPMLSLDQSMRILKDQFNFSSINAKTYAALFQNGIRLDWIENWDYFMELRHKILDTLKNFYIDTYSARYFYYLNDLAQKQKIDLALEVILSILRDILLVKHMLGRSSFVFVNQDLASDLKNLAFYSLEVDKLIECIDLTLQAIEASFYQANNKINLITLFLRFKQILQLEF